MTSQVPEPGADGPGTLHLHIGASKTGTSALQSGLFASVPALKQQGVGVPLVGREAHVSQVLRPLGWRTARGFVKAVNAEHLERLTPVLAGAGRRVLLTSEDLCEADEPRIRAVVGVADRAGLEVRVLLSLRSLAAVVPSEWQQFLKHRVTLDYPTFLARVRDRKGPVAQHFWQRQDALATVERWAGVVGADHVDVVVTPHRSEDPDGLYRLFGEIVGFDPALLSWPERDVNASWGYVEAEVYRRLNVALGDRLPRYDRDYQPAVRWPLVQGVLARGASGRITLPPEHVGWVREHATVTRDGLRAAGVRIHGDLDALVPAEDVGAVLPALDEREVAQAAVETLAAFAAFVHRRDQRRRVAGYDRIDAPLSVEKAARAAMRLARRARGGRKAFSGRRRS